MWREGAQCQVAAGTGVCVCGGGGGAGCGGRGLSAKSLLEQVCVCVCVCVQGGEGAECGGRGGSVGRAPPPPTPLLRVATRALCEGAPLLPPLTQGRDESSSSGMLATCLRVIKSVHAGFFAGLLPTVAVATAASGDGEGGTTSAAAGSGSSDGEAATAAAVIVAASGSELPLGKRDVRYYLGREREETLRVSGGRGIGAKG